MYGGTRLLGRARIGPVSDDAVEQSRELVHRSGLALSGLYRPNLPRNHQPAAPAWARQGTRAGRRAWPRPRLTLSKE